MSDFRDLRRDCRHVRWDRPCAPHKTTGAVCASCEHYDPVQTRVLVVKLAAVGDVLRTTAFLRPLHATWPGARVTWLTKANAADLFRHNPLVDEVLTTDDGLTAARLAVEDYDVVLCPDADPEAATLAAAARGGERRGFTYSARGQVEPLGDGADHWFRMGLSDGLKRANEETYQALVARVLGFDASAVSEPILEPSAEEAVEARQRRADWGAEGPLVGLNTGAGGRWEYKQWTFEHQSAFLQLAAARGWNVMLLGGPAEVERHRDLLASAPQGRVFDGGNRNSYGGFAALVDECAALVTGDTFAVHVAAARKVPAVVLFGPTSAPEIELYGRGEKLVPDGLDCLGCYLPRCDVEPHCQARILPEQVVDAVARQLRI